MDLTEVKKAAREFWRTSDLAVVSELKDLPLFDEPLLAVAAADDPLFKRFREADAAGVRHWLPEQWLSGAKSVLAYFLPFSQAVREANRSAGLPAKEWLFGRVEGELFNRALSAHLVAVLTENGHQAVAPALDARSSVVERRSNWSERHVAYAAGLGTFSLSCSLITKCGSAGRLGSIVVDAEFAATVRAYTKKDEYCTKCGACIGRCPPLAISEGGKDHKVCAEYLDRVLARFQPRYGCGKCQTKVPCEAAIPKA